MVKSTDQPGGKGSSSAVGKCIAVLTAVGKIAMEVGGVTELPIGISCWWFSNGDGLGTGGKAAKGGCWMLLLLARDCCTRVVVTNAAEYGSCNELSGMMFWYVWVDALPENKEIKH